MRIAPFRGYRHGGTARDLTSVVAPPYDQISPPMQEALYAMSPDNIVRVSFPRDTADDKYRRARETLDRWLAEGVWVREEVPAIYPYQQTYGVGDATITRAGLVVLGEVTPYAQGTVLPHERTHAGPKRDRMRLLEATRRGHRPPLHAGQRPDGRDPAGQHPGDRPDRRGPGPAWRDAPALAGDRPGGDPARPGGHGGGPGDHRRRPSSLRDGRRVRGATPRGPLQADGPVRPRGAGLDYPAEPPAGPRGRGLRLAALPRGGRALVRRGVPPRPPRVPADQPVLGVVAGAESAVLTLRDDAFDRLPWPPGTSAAWRALAVSILHEGLLRPLLDITDARLDARTHVDYTADQAEAVSLARAGRYQAAFLIAPTTPPELQAVVRGGELLPQKSTHFYPKLLDGLVFNRLGDS